jgi:hypothetical protein
VSWSDLTFLEIGFVCDHCAGLGTTIVLLVTISMFSLGIQRS